MTSTSSKRYWASGRRTAEPDEELARAVACAQAADVTVVVVGTNEEIETEGRDRATMSLAGRQDELVRRVAEVNSKTVVVVISGAPVAMPWRDQVSAVVLAPFGGQELGRGLADVLLGVTEPGGRLATTWGAEDADVPVLVDTPGRRRDGLRRRPGYRLPRLGEDRQAAGVLVRPRAGVHELEL